jgi:multicomponent Na+:H+ antiporter subunit G
MSFREIMDIIANIVIIIGIICMVIGAYGLFKFKDFYPRLLIASKIDTVGLMTVLFGICIRMGFSFFSLKVIFIILIILILNPLVAHIIAQGAYRAGYQLKGTLTDEASQVMESEEDGEMQPTDSSQEVSMDESEKTLVESESEIVLEESEEEGGEGL